MTRIIVCATLGWIFTFPVYAFQILRWERLPLAVSLAVGQERVVFVDRRKTLRVGVPAHLTDRLRVQSAGGAVYLLATAPIEPSRLQLQDAGTGELLLIDITAKPAVTGETALEPIRIVDGEREDALERERELSGEIDSAARVTPLPVVLTRYAAQSLYAPLRTVEPVAGITAMPLRRDLALETLLPTLPVRAKALAAWRLEDYWVTAVKLTNTRNQKIDLDPRWLQGDFISTTFQHPDLGPAGDSTDTTVAYLVTRGHGLAESLLPSISRIDATLNARPRSAENMRGSK